MFKSLEDTEASTGGLGGAGHWIVFDSIPDHVGGLSGGEGRLLLIAAALGSINREAAVNFNDALPGLDRNTVDLVLAAVSHAAGSHQGVTVTLDDNNQPVFSKPLEALYPWPENGR